MPTGNIWHDAQDLIFKKIHHNRLIYNACWEDPRIDRQLLKIDERSKIVALTSAGCNVLEYLLDSPAEIHSVDLNQHQNALLQLKIKLIERGNFADFFAFFGEGSHRRYRKIYDEIKHDLPPYARAFWNRKIDYFNPRSIRKSFYFRGASGDAAWFLNRYFLRNKSQMRRLVLKLLEAKNLEQQKEIFDHIEPRLWNVFVRWLLKHPLFLAHLGVPRPQIELISFQYPGGLASYVRDNIRAVATEVPIWDNYFWRVYITGSYTKTCCPSYLKEENFETLRTRINRIKTYTCSFTQFLQEHPGVYTHFVLLDHQDWLAWHAPASILEEWNAILANSRPGSKVLLRSAGLNINFLPAEVLPALRFHDELTNDLHKQDRVGTYGCLSMAEVL